MSKKEGELGETLQGALYIAAMIDSLLLPCVVLLFTERLFAGNNSMINCAKNLRIQIHNFPQKKIKDA